MDDAAKPPPGRGIPGADGALHRKCDHGIKAEAQQIPDEPFLGPHGRIYSRDLVSSGLHPPAKVDEMSAGTASARLKYLKERQGPAVLWRVLAHAATFLFA